MTSHTTHSTIQGYHHFNEPIGHIELPQLFNFPFYYTPHPLSILAAEQLQNYIKTQKEWEHDFGFKEDVSNVGIGKMFGVLVVKNKKMEVGFLAAFSGKLAGHNEHLDFVPPVFDMLQKGGYFKRKEEELNAINRKIEELENSREYLNLLEEVRRQAELGDYEIKKAKEHFKTSKKKRRAIRSDALSELSKEQFDLLKEEHTKESLRINYDLKDLVRSWKYKIDDIQTELAKYEQKINYHKEDRKKKSKTLQTWLFKQYNFLNAKGQRKDLLEIFGTFQNLVPPAGAGECAAPKLLQQAYLHDLEPVCMAEFWWGPVSHNEIRKPGRYYPSCRSKCEPILGHMLKGLKVEANPMLNEPGSDTHVEIVYEDESLMIINKPHELLSVPGKSIKDSVFTRMKALVPLATGPLIVHRLDMSTSGLMVIAKSKEVYRLIQKQFIRRKVKKSYVAILEGELSEESGSIDLPLRVDLDNRPYQMVCYQYGKSAQSRWELIGNINGKARIRFYPITGRTHQLRVHASHPLGLNNPILGDDLYGVKGRRLHLHAEKLAFWHPELKKQVTFESAPKF